ncbi:MAG: 50S ribosomal protein L29 [Gemmataceae bacterium]
MKARDLRSTADEELGNHLKETERRLFELRFQSATDRLETPSAIRKAKRDIARIRTIQRERELKASK